MSKAHSTELASMLLGGITAASIGSFLFQALGVLLLGAIGAAGGWAFEHFIKPKLIKFFPKEGKEA